MTILFGTFLLTLLVITGIAVVQTKNLFVAVMLMGIASLLIAANFFLLDAADVALTEAAVGAGVATVLFLSALALTAEHERDAPARGVLALIVLAAVSATIIYATFDMPEFGDPQAPIQTHVAPWYLEKTPEYIDIPNIVTAVLGAYRGYDTLGEVFVVFTAGIGVLFLLGAKPGFGAHQQAIREKRGLRHHLILRVVGRMLIPFILLFGLYVQFHGEYGPGGGFQAGALVAASIILYALIEGEQRALNIMPQKLLIGLMSSGGLIYGGTGVLCMLLGGNFLDYSVLASDPVKGQQLGILIIEAGVGFSVTGVLLSVFHAFAARER